jgi:hypothetical protein
VVAALALGGGGLAVVEEAANRMLGLLVVNDDVLMLQILQNIVLIREFLAEGSPRSEEATLILGADDAFEHHHHTLSIMGYKLVVRGRSSSSLLGCLSLIGLLLLLGAVAIAAIVPICFIVLVDELLLALESHVGNDVETAEVLLHIWPDLEQGVPLLFVLVGNNDV